ncbi:hypothetical protein GCM10010191_59330 [Actinomadura vinacea]|uniref:Holin n=1 Tax=Actinomadura vinacea TaxID=115336 RepID=A0ABN3JPL5_9ACTN
MISLRALTILTVTALVAAVTAALALADGNGWPAALLAAGTAAGGTLGILPRLIDNPAPRAPDDRDQGKQLP